MSSRVDQDRPQPYLRTPILLLDTTETVTPDDHIIKGFDGDFTMVIADYGSDEVEFQVRVKEHVSSRDGSTTIAETDWVTYKTFDDTGLDIASFSRNCEYRCETAAAGARVFIADAQWQGVV